MQSTQPRHAIAIPLRTLKVRVTAGPDAGAEINGHEEPITIGTAEGCALRLTDRAASRFHAEISPAPGGFRVRDLGSRNGTRAGGVRVIDATLPAGTALSIGASDVRVEDGGVHDVDAPRITSLVGEAPLALLLARRIERAARTEAPVLVNGESGTGKELVARALHDLSPRAAAPFVVVDCASIAPTLVQSELFGHEKGAFTGARERREGAFERAHGGTLFLDEIGELPAAVQPQLLGALSRGHVRRVGGEREIAIDVRVIAATHRDLRAAVNQGSFRADLLHRLAVVSLSTPPLRARPDDIPALVDHFLRGAGWAGRRAEIIDDDTLARWCEHPWPGNVRELKNATLAALAMREPPELEPAIASGAFAELSGRPFREARDEALARFERRYLEVLLESTRENVSEAARRAGIDRTHLHELLRRHGRR
jgi:DNA-binding NtrC family response regulator